ncbi:MAG: hypothetical protein BWK76_28495 [Desulfobulbaceae bacterium A2]|nr:MAG: hypothetical protein BWK76_28495 [Desulfobulbaceae bacterium A2]
MGQMHMPQLSVPRLLMVLYALFFCFVVWYGVIAARTFDGAVKDSYEKGMAYPAQVARLKELGWSFEGGPRLLIQGQADSLQLRIVKADGTVVRDAEVELIVSRPAAREALPALIAQETTPGLYQTPVTLPKAGHWFVTATVRWHGESFTYEFRTYAEERNAHHGT